MEICSIFSALRRNSAGAALIAVQMAVTMAILCNSLFIIQQRLSLSMRPTGVDEGSVFVIENQWLRNEGDLPSRITTDLSALRSLRGVVDAYVTNSVPLSNSGESVPA